MIFKKQNVVIFTWELFQMKFSELVRVLEKNGFEIVREKGSIRYYAKPGETKLIRIDYHGSKEIPSGTCDAILKAAGLKKKGRKI
jgi:predicted RNA binding protein YcfA (HicA-like mRNA interferase family)